MILAMSLLILIALGLFIYSLYLGKGNSVLLATDPVVTATSSIIYKNNTFGFNFSLPDSWQGYSIIKSAWEGNPITATSAKQTGPKLLIRNPKWTSALPYEDIPVMVFTLEQWSSYVAGNFSVSAAPVEATELGRNNLYVFALPPRWNFDYSEEYIEAENIIKSNPLKAFDIENDVSGKLNIDFVCGDALSYMSFSDSVSAEKFVSDCKEGKYPEVIEKYKAELNIDNGAVI